eukprot:scaffold1618_cov196-Alexandrium_tamarense.AAC.18
MVSVCLKPAYEGAPFDALGNCLYHPEVKLSQKQIVEGKLVYKERCKGCPKCSTATNTTTGSTNFSRMNSAGSFNNSSVSAGAVTTKASHNRSNNRERRPSGGGDSKHSHHTMDGSARSGGTSKDKKHERRPSGGSASTGIKSSKSSSTNNDNNLVRSNSRSRARSRSRGRDDEDRSNRPRSRSRGRGEEEDRSSRPRSRSRGRGEEEDRSSRPRSRSRGRGEEDDKSKNSSRRRAPSMGRKVKKEYDTPFDGKGRCHYHSGMQLAKKKLTGGWKVLLDTCPKCMEDSYINDHSDNRSVSSRRSANSSRSVRSSRSVKSTRSTRSTGRNFLSNRKKLECPFDRRGYCHRHSQVRLAKKKITGGWKILQDFCLECATEDTKDDRSVSSKGSRYSKRSSETKSSRFSRRSRGDDSRGETESAHSTSQSDEVRKKIVKKMSYTDDSGEEGLYTGYVNMQYKPHGRGKLVYGNGTKYDGTWCEGSKVHGKTGKSKSGAFSSRGDTSKTSASGNSSHGGKESGARGRVPPRPPQQQMSQQPRPQSTTPPKQQSQRQQSQCLAPPKQQPQSPVPLAQPKQQLQKQQLEIATDMKEYRDLYTSTLLTVKNMKFIDFYGDPGRYTGEVNEKKMPHGMGVQTYDHGLVQEGKWTNGILDEGSVMSCHPKNSSGSVASSRKSPSTSWRGGGASSVASGRSRVKDP